MHFARVQLAGCLLVPMLGCIILLAACNRDNPDDGVPPGTWTDSLPIDVRDAVLWCADHEEGDLSDWEDKGTDDPNAGGGIFNTGGADVCAAATDLVAHSGTFAAEATITNAVRAENGSRAVRLMRWTDRAWDADGRYFPDEAFYSTWMYLPCTYDPAKQVPWDPGDGGWWWNVFQFKSDNGAGSQPVCELDVYNQDGQMHFGLSTKHYPDHWSDCHEQEHRVQQHPRSLPVGRWFHVEVYYRKSADCSGAVQVWQDGVEIFDVSGLQTLLGETATWGLGNYTDHISGGPVEGTATIYFDDALVSTRPVHEYLD